ncbi:hypothetical protein GUJ93_ZPchr0012g21318 [Zizania palustris]|uniref:HMA domain-containing protein n=1 Tax=Zizania palustris TaxID=103762 RepID=A0A8J5WN93_ZIZPA|nr:hypothetical protein GUJ93_ZPchr0012g21318 [Zizania palustris]
MFSCCTKKTTAVPPSPSAVLGLELHCEGCARKIKKNARKIPGVEKVTTNVAANQMTIFGPAANDVDVLELSVGVRPENIVTIISAPCRGEEPSTAPARI